MKNTGNIRTTYMASKTIEEKLEKANIQRLKRNKIALTKSKAVELAVNAVTHKTLVEA